VKARYTRTVRTVLWEDGG